MRIIIAVCLMFISTSGLEAQTTEERLARRVAELELENARLRVELQEAKSGKGESTAVKILRSALPAAAGFGAGWAAGRPSTPATKPDPSCIEKPFNTIFGPKTWGFPLCKPVPLFKQKK